MYSDIYKFIVQVLKMALFINSKKRREGVCLCANGIYRVDLFCEISFLSFTIKSKLLNIL